MLFLLLHYTEEVDEENLQIQKSIAWN